MLLAQDQFKYLTQPNFGPPESSMEIDFEKEF